VLALLSAILWINLSNAPTGSITSENATIAPCQPVVSINLEDQGALLAEHMYGGLPGGSQVLIRQAYVLSYDTERRNPSWAAFHVIPHYLNTPKREGVFDTFRADPDIANEAKDSDYTNSGYDRGHIAPYNIAGGDRDGDCHFAAEDINGDGKIDSSDVGPDGKPIVDDEDDFKTIKQINYMSNIAPQHKNFNRNSGLWFDLERYIQDTLVENNGMEVWVIAGTIFTEKEPVKIGSGNNIHVPQGFYQIVIARPNPQENAKVLAFRFGHPTTNEGDIFDFLVSIDEIEVLAGLDFFSASDDGINDELEATDTDEFRNQFP